MADTIQITINGKLHIIGAEESVTGRLVSYLRDQVGTGTHYTCYQGGCGACTVVATAPDPATGGTRTFSINSCLASLYNCDGWSITTIEGLGNREDGYHVIQERLAEYYGTQCGYCSPAMVMNMYGLTQEKSSWTDDDVEKHLDGHICRCTGYRPILAAFKSLTPADIEDLDKAGCAKAKSAGCCQKDNKSGGCCRRKTAVRKTITVDGVTFHSPTTIQELLTILGGLADGSTYTFVFGNTAVGWSGTPRADNVISTRNVSDLADVTVTATEVTAGAGVSFTTLRTALQQAKDQSGFAYLQQVDDHIQKLASSSIRNLGGWAGNLALKIQDTSFPSDFFMLSVAAEAQVLLGVPDGSSTWYTVESLVGRDLTANKEVMLRLRFLPASDDSFYYSYKVSPRNTLALAYVGAAHKLQVGNDFLVTGTPVLAYSGISSTFNRATSTETYLVGQDLRDEAVLQAAFAALDEEVVPDEGPGIPDPAFKKQVAKALLYKSIMSVVSSLGGTVDSTLLSGATSLVRPLSSGAQTFDNNESTWPLGQPIPKLEAKAQCAGEAKYINDAPTLPDELTGRFVQSTRANATIVSIDASAALAVPGIVGFVSAADIRGVNNMQPHQPDNVEPVFADGKVGHYGQAIGMVVGDSDAVRQAAGLVQVTYADEQTPVITIEDSLAAGRTSRAFEPLVIGDVEAGFAASTHIVEGAMHRNGQYHFHMETQIARVIPNEDNFDVFCSTQWTAGAQAGIAQVLDVPTNTVNVTVKRLGGGFGAKIVAGNLVSTATAVAAQKFRKPVRVSLDLETNMSMIGWRDPFYFTYKAGVDDAGKLQAIEANVYGDSGFAIAMSCCQGVDLCMASCYECPNWNVQCTAVTTDTACNTYCRSPTTVEGLTFMECLLEHIAWDIGMDPLEFRKLNLKPDGATVYVDMLPVSVRRFHWNHERKAASVRKVKLEKSLIGDMISQIEADADVANRKAFIVQFNAENRWRKRGLSVMPMMWPYNVASVMGFGVFIALYANDGTVAVCHSGVELGQGINTKVAQATAYALGCSLDKIQIKPSETTMGANTTTTGGSAGSDITTYCATQASTKIKARLDAMGLPADTPWEEVIAEAFRRGVILCEYYWNGPDEVNSYGVYGVACTEVEVDVLTGQFLVLRTDILEDAGTSLSPLVDVGQLEGSWVMGQGMFTTEEPKYDPATGAKVNTDTWNYKPPLAADIPTDLRVTLLSNTPNPLGVLSSKVTGEPPVALAYAVVMALRQAISSARADAGDTSYFQMDTPVTVDSIQQLCRTEASQFTLTAAQKSP